MRRIGRLGIGVLCMVCALVARGETVEAREVLTEVEKDRDYWAPALPYSADGREILIGVTNTTKLGWRSRCPGPRILLNAKKVVVRMRETIPGGRIMVVFKPVWPTSLVAQPQEVKTPTEVWLKGAWTNDVEYSTERLDKRFGWILKMVVFEPPKGCKLGVAHFGGVEMIQEKRPAEALRLDSVTGHRARFYRPELGESAAITVGNAANRKLTFSATFWASDYFGKRVAIGPMSGATLSAGETMRQALPDLPGKGVWKITGVFDCEGTVSTQEARVARLDWNRPLAAKRELGTFRLGIQSHVERFSPAVRMDLRDAAQAAGSRIVRGGLALQWSMVERERGVYDWAQGDRLVAECAEAGIAINTAVRGTPAWAKDLPKEERLECFGRFCGRLAERYRGKIDYYEYGNELDLRKEPSVEECAEILHAMHGPIKAADPQARVILGGMACGDSMRSAGPKVRRGFHEGVMTKAKGDYDAHAVHIHSPIGEYTAKIDYLLSWRKKLGITAPWYANETAITIMTPGEEIAAQMVWQKILYAWSRGSADYVWYNDFATLRVEGHRENGYGLLDEEMRPRATYAAFSALQGVLSDHEFERIEHHGSQREVLRFRANAQEPAELVLAGWDRIATSNVTIRVRTDATKAEACDLMGNRRKVEIVDGEVKWGIGANPSALVLSGARVAEPNAADLKAETEMTARIIVPEMEYGTKPDMLMFGADQVHELYEAIPEYEHRNWKWAGDLSARIFVARPAGKLCLRIAVEDDIHAPRSEDPTQGDAVVVKLSGREFTLVEGDTAPRCEGKPMKGARLKVTRERTQTVYELEMAVSKAGAPPWAPFKEIPMNVRIYDADAEGPDCWMEYRPWNGVAVEIR